MSTALRVAAPALGVMLAVSACAGAATSPAAPTGNTAALPVLNGLSTMDIVGALHSAGLPTPNPHDVTADKCAKLHCTGEVDSDTVSILKFDHSGAAQNYAGSISNSYQLEDIVLIFAPTVTAAQKAAYERVVERAVA